MKDIFTPKGKCQKCHKLKATGCWVGNGDVMSAIHGMYEYWCERCMLEAQIKHAKEHKNDLKTLQEKLKKLVQ
jgi:hypothetical protein